MANSIDLVTKFLPLLDEVYQKTAKSAFLEAPSSMVQQTMDANTIKIAKIAMDGLGDYSKDNGFPKGSVTLNWETHTFTNDRGRTFSIDKMDNLEALSLVVANTIGEFMRLKVIPEVDAYRFAKIASTAGIEGTAGTLTDTTTKAAIVTALKELENNQVDLSSLVLAMTPDTKYFLENNIQRTVMNGENGYNQLEETFNTVPIITIPQGRFYDKIDLYDGTTEGQTAGGYVKHVKGSAEDDVAGVDINFILMDKSAAFAVTKNAVTRVFSPEVNQQMDAWKLDYRFYHDLFVYDNKKDGIYVHKKAS